jgi:hypothetical protein
MPKRKKKSKKKSKATRPRIPFNVRMEALTVAYWTTDFAYLLGERGTDVRTAGERGVTYWKPRIMTKGWNPSCHITVWLDDGEVPAFLCERKSGRGPAMISDVMVLGDDEQDVRAALAKCKEGGSTPSTDLLPFRIKVIDGMNRSLALTEIWQESTTNPVQVTFRVLHKEGCRPWRCAIAATLNDEAKVCPSVVMPR